MTDYHKCDTPIFSASLTGQTVIIRLKADAFKIYHKATYMNEFLQCMNNYEVDENIRGILIIDSTDYHDVEQYQNFLQTMQHEKASYAKEKGITRYSNASKRVTMLLNQFSKPIVFAIDGAVPIDSFGYFLAGDYVMTSDNFQIQFPSVPLGITPTGAATFFLRHVLTSTQLFDILLSGKELSAQQALELNLINKIVPSAQLEAKALEKIESYYHVSEITIATTKQLIKVKNHELEEHFENSARIMWASVS